MKQYLKIFAFSPRVDYKTEVMAGLTVALALIPEAVAFSLIAGLPPLVGLYAAFVLGLVTAVFGGRPGMISGATGAIAVIIVALAKTHGIEYVFATVVLAGLTIAIIVLLPRLTKAVPSSLVAIVVVFGLVVGLGIETKTVGDIAKISGGFPPFHIPAVPLTLATLQLIFPYAAIMAGVGLIESLLTLNLIDQITETRGHGNRECLAQGGGNILSGLFFGMGGCAMLDQSLINVSAGARARQATAL